MGAMGGEDDKDEHLALPADRGRECGKIGAIGESAWGRARVGPRSADQLIDRDTPFQIFAGITLYHFEVELLDLGSHGTDLA